MKLRFLAPVETGHNTVILPNGQALTLSAGSTYDCAHAGEAQLLGSNGWLQVGWTAPTTGRPAGAARGQQSGNSPDQAGYRAPVGFQMVDTTLNSFITWDGKVWRDPTGASV